MADPDPPGVDAGANGQRQGHWPAATPSDPAYRGYDLDLAAVRWPVFPQVTLFRFRTSVCRCQVIRHNLSRPETHGFMPFGSAARVHPIRLVFEHSDVLQFWRSRARQRCHAGKPHMCYRRPYPLTRAKPPKSCQLRHRTTMTVA